MVIIRNIIPKNVDHNITVDDIKLLNKNMVSLKLIKAKTLSILEEFLTPTIESKYKTSSKTLWVIPTKPNYIMILSKRLATLEYLKNYFDKANVRSDTFFGTKKDYDPEAQILLVGVLKGGIGFNDTKFNVAFYVSDIGAEFQQTFGRIRKGDGIHYDFVDSFDLSKRHLSERIKIYQSAEVKVYDEFGNPYVHKPPKKDFGPIYTERLLPL